MVDDGSDEWLAYEEEEIGKLNVIIKMAGFPGSVFYYKDGPGIVFRAFWITSRDAVPIGGFEEDEVYEHIDDLKDRVHRVCNAHILSAAMRAEKESGVRD